MSQHSQLATAKVKLCFRDAMGSCAVRYFKIRGNPKICELAIARRPRNDFILIASLFIRLGVKDIFCCASFSISDIFVTNNTVLYERSSLPFYGREGSVKFRFDKD